MGMATTCHNIITKTLNLEASIKDSPHFNSSGSALLLSAYFFVADLSKTLNVGAESTLQHNLSFEFQLLLRWPL